MSPTAQIPALLRLEDPALLGLRLVVAVIFGTSGWFHLRDPVGRARSVELSPAATATLGAVELLASVALALGLATQLAALALMGVGLGAIGKKIVAWKIGFWGEKASGWHYDLMLLAMNLVVLTTAGGGWTVPLP